MYKNIVPVKNEIKVSVIQVNIGPSKEGGQEVSAQLVAMDNKNNVIASFKTNRFYPLVSLDKVIECIKSTYEGLTDCVITFDSSTLNLEARHGS